MVVKAKEWIA